MRKMILAVCVAACGLSTAAWADPNPTPVAQRRGGWVIVTPTDPVSTGVSVVQRETFSPPIVSRELHEQPVWDFLAEVRVVGTTTYIDPLADYQGDGTNGLDENHWLVRAQRQFITSHSDTSAYVIVGSPEHPMALHPEPTMIFLKPGSPGSIIPRDNYTPAPIPNAPLDTKTSPKVVMAH